MLEPDRLLWSFRKTAGLSTPGEPYIASWEDPGCELRGHFVGHYLSALSLAWAATGNPAFQSRLSLMVSELDKAQTAIGLGGYLSAFPAEFFDRVEALKPVWAPYYTIHKLLAGLVDAWELGGQARALPMAEAMVAYHWNRTHALIVAKGQEHWKAVLNCEFGGMNELLYRLYRTTRNPDHLAFAKLFDKPQFREPMTRGHDALPGLHANTHLAQVAGFAEAYEVTGDPASRTATINFFNILTQHHSFATGGSNDHEFWQAPDTLADSIWKAKDAVETQETCTQYNILKIARSLFRWTGEVAYADYYERALLNGILGTARLPPEDWPEYALPHRHGDEVHHHHTHHQHHHHHARRSVVSGGGGAAISAGGGGAAAGPVAVHRRPHNEEYLNWWAFAKPQPEWNASDAHGPGVFLYLMPMGTGQSKSDNIHHWGFPFHSFWCCYGTVVESYAKLADSIYFKDMSPQGSQAAAAKLPPRLYVNQLVSSRANWTEMGLRVSMEADMFAPGPAATADIRFERLATSDGRAAGQGGSSLGSFTLMVRVPEWAASGARSGSGGAGVGSGSGGITVSVNGQAWTSCPGPPAPGSYCQVTRPWHASDSVWLRLPMRWALKPPPETREEYRGLAALMMGPFVMAGLTHDTRMLLLPPAAGGPEGGAGGGGGLPDVTGRVYPPEEADELVSLQAGWNASLHARHDSHLLYLSALEDGGDAMDATFRLGRGCHHGIAPGAPSEAGGGDGAGGGGAGGAAAHHSMLAALHGHGNGGGEEQGGAQGEGHGSLSSAFASLRSLMRLGQADAGQALSLEAMAAPNHYLAWDQDDVIVLQPGSSGDAGCSHAGWMMRVGLDGQPDSVSFEAVGRPGWFISAAAHTGAAGAAGSADHDGGCHDAPLQDCEVANPMWACSRDPYIARVLCRRTCGSCNSTAGALRLRLRVVGDTAFAAASSFRMAAPARRAYPAGSYVLAGDNRHYLVAPLGNLIDERYTAYFMVLESKSAKQ